MRQVNALSQQEWLAELEKQRVEQKQRQALEKLERKGLSNTNDPSELRTIMDSAVWHTEGNGNPIRSLSGRVLAAYGSSRQTKTHHNVVSYGESTAKSPQLTPHMPASEVNTGASLPTTNKSEPFSEEVPYFERFRQEGGCGAPRRRAAPHSQMSDPQVPAARLEGGVPCKKTAALITSYIEHADASELMYKEAMKNEWKRALDQQIKEKEQLRLQEKIRREREDRVWETSCNPTNHLEANNAVHEIIDAVEPVKVVHAEKPTPTASQIPQIIDRKDFASSMVKVSQTKNICTSSESDQTDDSGNSDHEIQAVRKANADRYTGQSKKVLNPKLVKKGALRQQENVSEKANTRSRQPPVKKVAVRTLTRGTQTASTGSAGTTRKSVPLQSPPEKVTASNVEAKKKTKAGCQLSGRASEGATEASLKATTAKIDRRAIAKKADVSVEGGVPTKVKKSAVPTPHSQDVSRTNLEAPGALAPPPLQMRNSCGRDDSASQVRLAALEELQLFGQYLQVETQRSNVL